MRPDCNRLGATRELPPLRVEHVVLKRELHLGPPRSRTQASDTRPRQVGRRRQSGQAIDSTAIIVGHGIVLARSKQPGTAGASRLPWTNNQAKFNRNSRPLQGLPAGYPASSVRSIATVAISTGRLAHEDRRHRRQRPDRNKARQPLRRPATRSSPRRRTPASTPSLAKDWRRRSPAPRSSSTWRTRHRSRTRPLMDFFETSGRNLLAAEAVAGVKHHLALSVVGTERLPGERLPPREGGPGKADQGFRDPVHHSAFDAVLRVHRRHRQIGRRRRRHPPAPALVQPIAVGRCRRCSGRFGRRTAGERHHRGSRARACIGSMRSRESSWPRTKTSAR